MKNIDVEGKTKDEALAKGLASLGLSRAQVRVDILDEGGRGFLGLGGKPVRLRLRAIEDGETDPADVVRTLLELMEVKFALAVEIRGDETDIRIDAPEDDGLLIGRRGQTLDALRHLSQRIVAARKGRNAVVNIDVGDYRARREAGLAEKAQEAANQALADGRSLTLDPMSAQDRRIVHLALAERTDVSTYTVGRGSRRRVVIAPAGTREDETAYDRVPDPGFKARRLPSDGRPDEEEDEATLVAEAQWRREEERERLRGVAANTGREGQRLEQETRTPARSLPAGETAEREERGQRAPRRRGGRGRNERGRGEGRPESRSGSRPEGASEGRGEGRGEGRSQGERGRGPRGRGEHAPQERPAEGPPPEVRSHEESPREERGRPEHGAEHDRDEHRRERRPRDHEERRGEDRGGWSRGSESEQASGPAATRKEDLSPSRVVGDDSDEKAFPRDLASRILKMGGEDSSQSARRRRRR